MRGSSAIAPARVPFANSSTMAKADAGHRPRPVRRRALKQNCKKKLDQPLASGDPETAGVIQSAIESFAQELAIVLRRFLKLKGLEGCLAHCHRRRFYPAAALGELAIGRASVLLSNSTRSPQRSTCLSATIRTRPACSARRSLSPAWMFEAHDAILAVDIGGTNIRAGVVQLNLAQPRRICRRPRCGSSNSGATATRNISTARKRSTGLIEHAATPLSTGCEEGRFAASRPSLASAVPARSIPTARSKAGAQNLPGNWESSRFNLPEDIV